MLTVLTEATNEPRRGGTSARLVAWRAAALLGLLLVALPASAWSSAWSRVGAAAPATPWQATRCAAVPREPERRANTWRPRQGRRAGSAAARGRNPNTTRKFRRGGEPGRIEQARQGEGESADAEADRARTGAPAGGDRATTSWLRALFEGGNLRATVMGGTDGLITSLAFVFGVAGLSGSTQLAILAGVISAVGGALSMAAGEWLSVTSQNERYRSTLAALARQLREDSREAHATLRAAGLQRGYSQQHAEDLASTVCREPSRLESAAVDLGLIPRALDCPAGAAFSSFASFLTGATLPLIPLIAGANGFSLALSATVSAVALAAGGAWLASSSGKSPLRGALRMLALGGAAAAATYGTGVLATTVFPWH